jgi:hypothetical protein
VVAGIADSQAAIPVP